MSCTQVEHTASAIESGLRSPLGAGVPRKVVPGARLVIAGVGNLLRSDDGFGIHVIRELERLAPEGVLVLDVGTAILHTLSFFEAAERALVIDAVRGGHPPGTVYAFDLDDSYAARGGLTLHSMGIKEALKVAAPGVTPPAISVLGVEPANLDYGLELSPPVQAAIPQVLSMALQTVNQWLQQMNCKPGL